MLMLMGNVLKCVAIAMGTIANAMAVVFTTKCYFYYYMYRCAILCV